MLKRPFRTWSQLGIVAACIGLSGVMHESVDPYLVYHDGDNMRFAPEVTGTNRLARLGPWSLGERLPQNDEKPSDERLNLYVVIPGGQYHSRIRPQFDHNLVVNKYTIDGKPREWDLFWCLQLDPSLRSELRKERELLEGAQQRFQPPATFSMNQIPSRAVITERLGVRTVDDLKRFRRKDGSLPRLLIVPAHIAVRATVEQQSSSEAKK